jgi:hypothetical protein
MGIFYNTSIVKDGLVLYLDAANQKSYPGSGATWYDLSGNGSDATLVNAPGYVSAGSPYLTFNGTTQTASVLKPYPNVVGTITSEIWVYFNTVATVCLNHKGLHYTLRITNDTYAWADSSIYSYSSYGYTTVTGINTTGVWKQLVVTKDSSNVVRLYINGILSNTHAAFGSALAATASTLWIVGYSDNDIAPLTGSILDGRVSVSRIYNRNLSDAEISQNFEATRDRYGI